MLKNISDWVEKTVDSWNLPAFASNTMFFNNIYIGEALFFVFLIYIIFINIKTYMLFLKDKKLAEKGEFRIKESRLLTYCFSGGAIGGYLGMKTARHKTKKLVFAVGVRFMLIVQVLIISALCGFFGFWIYMG